MEGKIIANKYRLVRLLGKGGMGSVWLAEHLTLQSPVAIKLIDFVAAKNPMARARFDREAQVAARIKSAHVVKVLDHGVTEDDLPYIAMECLTGESLRDRIQARGRLTPAETAKVVSHLSRALARAHEAGLVHRDIKPENVFLAREDDGEIVKILDFGVAKATDLLSTAGMDPTRTGALLGTPYYMSPEQAQGLKSIDYRSDLWSMGVLAFECLTGKRPFTAPALGPLIAKIVHTPAPTFAQVAPEAGVSPEIEAWFQKALARDPAQRFSSAKELSDSFLLAAGVVDTLDSGASIDTVSAPVYTPSPQAHRESARGTGTIVMETGGDALDNAATVALPSTLDGAPAAPAHTIAMAPAPAPAPPAPVPKAPEVATISPAAGGSRTPVWIIVALASSLVVIGVALAMALMHK